MSYRDVPDGWVEFTDAFIEEVKIGVRAGWQYFDEPGFGESLFYAPEDGEPQAWAVRRNRILGSPIGVVVTGDGLDS